MKPFLALPIVLAIVSLSPQTLLAEDIQVNRPEGVVTDLSNDMLEAPATLQDATDFVVAKTAPSIRFSVAEDCEPVPEYNQGVWSSWSESLLASDGYYYAAIGNHSGVDGRTYIVRYDPKTGAQKRVFDSFKNFNHQPETYGHGKIHGRLEEYPKGYIIAATYWGIPPLDTRYKDVFWTGPIPGGRLIRVDMAKGITEDLGVLFERDSWPMFATDTKRGIFYAVGYDKHFLAYDLKAGRSLYAALPPANVEWAPRATLLDEKTGDCYSTSRGRFVKYDLKTKKIVHLESTTPNNPNNEEEPGELRCYTRHRTSDGAFLCQTMDGVIFKFFPDTDSVETVAINWRQGNYTTSMALSPGERYLYYTVDVHGDAYAHGSPVVQYDLKENTRKVITFLHPYYQKKYGYIYGGSYSVTLNEDGSQLFIVWNGKFRSEEKGPTFGDLSFMLIDIPSSERVE